MATLSSFPRGRVHLRRLRLTAPTISTGVSRLRTKAYDYASPDNNIGHGGSGSGLELDMRAAEGEWPGFNLRSPKQLVQYLDNYVVGQERAKKILAVAVFNHYNRVRANLSTFDEPDIEEWPPESLPPPSMAFSSPLHFSQQMRYPGGLQRPFIQQRIPQPTFEKSNVLMIGPTGTGKTLLARTLARVLDVPFAMSDATTFTQAGYVGEDVETCIQRLLQAANWDVSRARLGIICIDECDKLARRQSDGNSKDVSGEGVQQALLRMLEGSLVTVSGSASAPHPPPSAPADLSSGTLGRSTRRTREGLPGHAGKAESYQIDTSNILFILSGAFVGLEKVVRSRVAKGSIGFDAPLLQPDAESEGEKVSKAVVNKAFVPFFTPNADSDEFNLMDLVEPADMVKYGFIPEFISRLPVICTLHHLSPRLLLRVLNDVRNSLVSQYSTLFSYSGAEMRFTSEALWEIAMLASKKGSGARGLRGIMESVLLEAMYDVPGSSIRYVLITAAVVRGEHQAYYWSRGESNLFWSDLAAEEFAWGQGKGKEFQEDGERRDSVEKAQEALKGAEEERPDRPKEPAHRADG